MFRLNYHKMIKCIMKPFTISSCSHKSSFVIRNPKLTSEINLIRQTLNQNDMPTTNEWHKLRDQLNRMRKQQTSPFNIDILVLACCLPTELEAGKSYMGYLRETGLEPDLTASINLLKLYYRASKAGTEITNDDQRHIIAMYEHFAKKYPVFDNLLGEGLIYGLVLTPKWRESLEILDLIKIASFPSPKVYSAVIQRAIQEEDEETVWLLMNDMVKDCKVLQKDVFLAYIEFCEKDSDKFDENINKMLTFIGDNQIIVTTDVTTRLHSAFQKFNYVCSITSVNKSGKLLSSHNSLRKVNLSDDEFNHLRSHFFDEIFIRDKIFDKSMPKEFGSFVKFVDQTKPFDIVIDGLNVAYSKRTLKSVLAANTLATVVKHLADRNKKLLVIGRKFMLNWPKVPMDSIQKNASLFLTENASRDDPFVLYSTLKSGPHTDFVTRDMIRDHACKLDADLKRIFRQWQLKHQLSIQFFCDTMGVVFRERIPFDMVAQQVNNCWYIPFENHLHCTFQSNNFELRKNWLCVSKGDS